MCIWADMNRTAVIATLALTTAALSACTPEQIQQAIDLDHARRSAFDCPTRDLGDKTQYDYTAERDYLGAWSKDGIILGFSAQEDGLVYYIRWCAENAPRY